MMTQHLQMVDDDYDSDELMWVKAGEPGEKPTIIRQIRSESSSSGSRDNSGGSGGSCGGHSRGGAGRNLLTVENGTVYRSSATGQTIKNSNESVNALEKLARTSSGESRVIVVNVQESIYPANVDRQRIQRWKERQSPRMSKRETVNANTTTSSGNGSSSERSPKGRKATTHNNNTIERSHFHHHHKESNHHKFTESSQSPQQQQRPLSQPASVNSNCSPKVAERCSSADPTNINNINNKTSSTTNSTCSNSHNPFNRVVAATAIKTRDEGYTSLTEDCSKDSDTDSVRSKSLPSTWRPIKQQGHQDHDNDLRRYAQQITSNTSTDSNYLYHDEGDDDFMDNHHHSNHNHHNSNDHDQKLLNTSAEKKALKRKEKRTRLRHNVENAIEICTCFVCLRSAVYHAEDEDDTDSLVDHPCSCEAPNPKCGARWCMIGLMVCFLPFLLCYPPLKTCLYIHDKRKRLKKAKKNEKKLAKMKSVAEAAESEDETTASTTTVRERTKSPKTRIGDM